jgi:hypothetical protein
VTRLQASRLRTLALIPGRRKSFFSTQHRTECLWDPPSFRTKGYLVLSSLVAGGGREASCSLPFSAEVKSAWGCTSGCTYISVAGYVIMLRDNVACTWDKEGAVSHLLRYLRRCGCSGWGLLVQSRTFFNPILFAICTSTFSKLCVRYTVTCRRELSSAPL